MLNEILFSNSTIIPDRADDVPTEVEEVEMYRPVIPACEDRPGKAGLRTPPPPTGKNATGRSESALHLPTPRCRSLSCSGDPHGMSESHVERQAIIPPRARPGSYIVFERRLLDFAYLRKTVKSGCGQCVQSVVKRCQFVINAMTTIPQVQVSCCHSFSS